MQKRHTDMKIEPEGLVDYPHFVLEINQVSAASFTSVPAEEHAVTPYLYKLIAIENHKSGRVRCGSRISTNRNTFLVESGEGSKRIQLLAYWPAFCKSSLISDAEGPKYPWICAGDISAGTGKFYP